MKNYTHILLFVMLGAVFTDAYPVKNKQPKVMIQTRALILKAIIEANAQQLYLILKSAFEVKAITVAPRIVAQVQHLAALKAERIKDGVFGKNAHNEYLEVLKVLELFRHIAEAQRRY